jgi:ABC-type bacteriocin/lantibiotic exporter with double-glycine peptidase domain
MLPSTNTLHKQKPPPLSIFFGFINILAFFLSFFFSFFINRLVFEKKLSMENYFLFPFIICCLFIQLFLSLGKDILYINEKITQDNSSNLISKEN